MHCSIHPVIATIPFQLNGKDKKHLLIGDVLAEELISGLSATQEMVIISRLSTGALRGRQASLEEVRTQLRANYVLSGTYSVRGNVVEFDAEFADTRTATVLWHRKFKEKIDALLCGPTEVVADIVAAISASVLLHGLKLTRSHPLVTLENYSLLMAAINLSHRTSPASFAQARSLFELLAERLPLHPLPLAWLAKWYVFKIAQGWAHSVTTDGQRAFDYAARAIESDPNCSVGLTVDAWAKLRLLKQFNVADQQFDRAIEANPNDSMCWLLKGTMHAFRGEGRAAV